MIIGIIGAGIAGLIAGRELAKMGHEVIVIDKSRGFGGRLATRYVGEDRKIKLDHGAPCFSAKNESFLSFINELEDKDIVAPWTDALSYYTEGGFYLEHPGREKQTYYYAPKGMNTIGKYLSRWLDFRLNEKVSGITMVAPTNKHKRPWIINLESSKVIEVDAVIIATPSIQAAGVLQLSQDETPIRAVHAKVEAVEYDSCHTLMLGFGDREIPDWKGVLCQDEDIAFVSNESSKRDNGELTLVVQTTHAFTRKHLKAPKDEIARILLQKLANIAGNWALTPYWNQVHYWKYHRPTNPISEPFIESTSDFAPLAVIGDYFNGNSVETAFVSGYTLAHHWSTKLAK